MGLFDFFKKDKEKEALGDEIEEEQKEDLSSEASEGNEETSDAETSSEEIQEIQEETEENREADKQAVESVESETYEVNTAEDKVEEVKSAEDQIESIEITDSAEDEETESDDETLGAEPQEETVEEEPEKKSGFFKRLVSGLTKTRNSISQSFSSVFAANHIDEDFYEELEEILIMADLGVDTTLKVLDELREEVKKQHIKEPKDCRELLISIIKNQMSLSENAYDFEKQTSVIMVIGVNGVGKTTTIGKLASQYRKMGKKVMMVAADTFRAAAIEQLTEWANRSQVDIIAQKEGSDPSAVVFDGLQAAKARKADIVLIDTAGRLHNKKNLMAELSKMNKIIDREFPEAYRETLIVLDGTTGQNAMEQAKQFKEVADIDGIVITKLDGTAKGGIAIAIHGELGVPVKYIGVGEGIDDLQKFDPDSYVNAIFTVNPEDAEGEEE